MQVQTLVAVAAVAVAHKEIAFRHLAQVVLVQELAALALFAEAAQPVLADEGAEASFAGVTCATAGAGGWGRVAVGAVGFEWARPGEEGFADGSVGCKAVLIGALEEGREVECVLW